MEKELYIKEMGPGIYLMDEAHEATGYLVVGKDKACLIDTMNGITDVGAAVRKLTDKPLVVVNTHGHWDHIGGHRRFDTIAVFETEKEWLSKRFPLPLQTLYGNSCLG